MARLEQTHTEKRIGLPSSEHRTEFPGVREILSFPRGLTVSQVKMEFDPKPPADEMNAALTAARSLTKQKRVIAIEAQGGIPDHDGDKVWLKAVHLDPQSQELSVTTGETKYFDLWGIPTASPEMHARFLEELPEKMKTEVPNGISTHNTILTSDGKIIMTVRSKNVGFSEGRVSASFEEQMEPKDGMPHQTVVDGLKEEFAIDTPIDSVRLLGLGAEKGSAYTAFCYVVSVDKTAEEIAKSWEKAFDKREGSALFAVPLENINAFTQDQILPEMWGKYHIAGDEVAKTSILQPHPTVSWRMQLVKEHLAVI